MKKQTILLSALALTMLASCEKEVITSPTETKEAQITMQLGQYGETKGVGGATTNNTQVAVGLSFNVESLGADASSLGSEKMDFTRVGTTSVYTATAEVNVDATKVKLIGNYDGMKVGDITLSSNINTRQGDATKAVVLVSGEGVISKSDPKAPTVAVSVKPDMARIEIVGTNTGDNFKNIKNVLIKAIYLNNIKLNRTDTELSTTKSKENFALDYAPKGVKYSLVDNNTTAGWQIVDESSVRLDNVFGEDQAVGYNIFPQTGGDNTDNHPHINIEISYDISEDGTTFVSKSGFINIKAFKTVPATYVTKFDAGNVYSFSVTDISNLIVDPNTPVSPEPEPDLGSVTITCTVTKWTVVTVTPEA